jgi:hypothetical protein
MLEVTQLLLFLRQVLQDAFWLVGAFVIALLLILYLVFKLWEVLQNASSSYRR